MAHENLKKKYGLTPVQMKLGIETAAKGLGMMCDIDVVFAIADLLTNGDIASDDNEQ